MQALHDLNRSVTFLPPRNVEFPKFSSANPRFSIASGHASCTNWRTDHYFDKVYVLQVKPATRFGLAYTKSIYARSVAPETTQTLDIRVARLSATRVIQAGTAAGAPRCTQWSKQ